jgi:hypothetical protein
MRKGFFILGVGRQPVGAVLTGLIASVAIENAKPRDGHLEAFVLSTWVVRDFYTFAGIITRRRTNGTDLYLHGSKIFDCITKKQEDASIASVSLLLRIKKGNAQHNTACRTYRSSM